MPVAVFLYRFDSILMLWIVLEWWIWGFVALSNIFFVLGLVEVIAAIVMIRRAARPGSLRKQYRQNL
jgi:hypothetical protein